MPLNIRTSIATLAILSAVTLGCARGEQDQEAEAPVAQTQSETETPLNRPTKVTGCLRAGDAANTFVLTTSLTEGVMSPATYHLTQAQNVNLRDYVGHQVQVDGTLVGQQQITTKDIRPEPAQRAEGTTGKADVETGTRLAVRELQVNGIRSIANECEQM